MKRLFLILCLAFAVPTAALLQSGCQHQVTLEQGGAYTDATLATTDQAILDASKTLTGFLDWHRTNATYLAQWPEVGQFAERVAAEKDQWIRGAYQARDSYAEGAKAFKAGAAALDLDERRAKLNAVLSLLANVTSQINAYKTSHPHG